MKGLEICEKYFNEYGKKMIDEEFAEYKDRIAAGLVGEGSECFGFDDELSKDHDFEPSFCLFITEEDERKFGFKLERAYAKLPKEYMGLKRQLLSPTGGNRRGVIVINEFYKKFLGASNAPDSLKRWFYTPSEMLATACNGKVFTDPLGFFSSVRNELLKGYPEDVRRKKIAANVILMAQSGQYNYGRCIDRGETGAAQLAIFEFVKHAISTVYLLNGKYEPYYKWAYRGMRELPILSDLEFSLSGISELGNSKSQASEKAEIIEDIAKMIIDELKTQKLTTATCNNLETHAYSVMDSIKDSTIRNMHVMEGV
ncbi:MAG: DUF4037 domain-containing protein [Clostridia bacterium]|nr:DUF4037 domain-containing protein [Clostridia bacterium]